MKQKILDLIHDKPKHYAMMIKKDPAMYDWVMSQSKADSEHFPTHIYSAINDGKTNICVNGNKREVSRISNGYKNCGPANVCECTRDTLSEKVSHTKHNASKEEKIKANQKRKATMVEKYGVEYNSQRSDIKHIWKKPKIPDHVHEKLSNKNWLEKEYITDNKSGFEIAKDLKIYYGTVLDYCRQHGFEIQQNYNRSLTEKEIYEYITTILRVKAVHSDWETLKTKELDILVPSHNFAIEVNGLYWHSYNPETQHIENRSRHIDKTLEAKEKGIDLIHITDYEWTHKKDIVKSIIRSKLGKNDKIYARNTTIQSVDTKTALNFMDRYHIQGALGSKYYFGLYKGDDLVMLISAGKNRFTKDDSIELHRLCSKSGITVVGGASKLIKHLHNIVNQPIISYCDRSKSNGNGYYSMGFELVKETGPGYYWTDGNEILSRYKCRKSNLKNWLSSFDSELSESKNMFNANYKRYWDCGNLVFIYNP